MPSVRPTRSGSSRRRTHVTGSVRLACSSRKVLATSPNCSVSARQVLSSANSDWACCDAESDC
eukprot:2659140-Lingulodinium_polyedra.AAC.1